MIRPWVMFIADRPGRASLTMWLATAVVAGAGLVAAAQQADTVEPISKLTTVLADLSRSVSQEGQVTTQQTRPAAPLAAGTFSKSVQDAMRGGLLRIDANSGV